MPPAAVPTVTLLVFALDHLGHHRPRPTVTPLVFALDASRTKTPTTKTKNTSPVTWGVVCHTRI